MEQSQNFLISELDNRSPIVEAFRTLRANIRFVGVDHPLQTLLITSSAPTEGKSSISANLAVAYAMGGKRVLIIDTDLRRPSLHHSFRTTNSFGLTNVLLGQRTLKDSIQETGIGDLAFIASGPIPPNPAELLGSSQIDGILEEAKADFEMVIIDTPPVLVVSDALLLAPKADGCLLVVASKGTKREAAKAALKALEKTKARVVGTVLNNYNIGESSQYYYYYYQEES
jgi:protein-tyrosine kinase